MAKKNSTPVTKRRGCLIVFEGLDGAGKSTHINAVAERVQRMGREVVVTRWGSDGVVGSYISDLLEQRIALSRHAFSALHAADFADQYVRVIQPALERGAVVLCDRAQYTEIARDVALDLPASWTEELFSWAPTPDLVVFLDLPVERAFERVRLRALAPPKRRVRRRRTVDGTLCLTMETEYLPDGEPMTELARRAQVKSLQERVRKAYETLRKQHEFTTVDAARPVAEVRRDVVQLVLSVLPT